MTALNEMLEKLFKNNVSGNIINLFLVLYAGLAAPKLPYFIKKIFKHFIIKAMVLGLIVYQSYKNYSMSLLIAISFMLTLDYLNQSEIIKEKFANDKCTQAKEFLIKHLTTEQYDTFFNMASDPRANSVLYLEEQLKNDQGKYEKIVKRLIKLRWNPKDCH